MAVEREYVGFEPFFAAGAYLAASANIGFGHIHHASALALSLIFCLLLSLYPEKFRNSLTAHRIMILATAFGAGAFCGLNGRLMLLADAGREGMLTSMFHNLGACLQTAIRSIPFESSSTNSIVMALLSGNREDIPEEIIHAFRASGASHILALSGLHLGIIYAIVSKITSILGGSRATKIVRCALNLSICTVYTLATGASASIIRALTFIILNETGRLSHRPQKLGIILRKSLMINLIIMPESIMDIGFQLSYAAMAGIAWIHPFLKKAWTEKSENSIMKKIWNTASMSISCQITTAPLAYIHFGSFPVYFLLTNLLALPLTGFIIPASALTVILCITGICPDILVYTTEKAIESMVFVLNTISTM